MFNDRRRSREVCQRVVKGRCGCGGDEVCVVGKGWGGDVFGFSLFPVVVCVRWSSIEDFFFFVVLVVDVVCFTAHGGRFRIVGGGFGWTWEWGNLRVKGCKGKAFDESRAIGIVVEIEVEIGSIVVARRLGRHCEG